jgi:hypothetical protein
VSYDAGATQEQREEALLQPTVSWPREMVVNRRHLVTVDLALVKADGSPGEWPLRDEEYTYSCLLDGGGVFDLWAVHDATVVLHRFGGSYGAAEFVVIPRKMESGKRSLWLTIINQWGISIDDYELVVDVRVPQGDQITIEDPIDPVTVPAGLSDVSGESGDEQPSGTGFDSNHQIEDDLAVGDQITMDIPDQDQPRGIDEDPPDVRLRDPSAVAETAASAPPAHTIPDSARTAEDQPFQLADLIAPTLRDDHLAPYAPADPGRRGGARRGLRLPDYYNVAGLRRSRSGRLRWDMIPLFSPGATRGDSVTFTARCAPSDEHGTVFAVLAEPENDSSRGPQLRSVQSAKVPPGIYEVTAELLYPGPGHVQFHGLPTPPREDTRPWQQIVTSVPTRVPIDGGPIHLIVAIEISGPNGPSVHERLESVRRLILHVAGEAADFVCYSIITYGPHSINANNPEYPEVPVATLAWAETADDALAVLDRLSRRGPARFGYEYAAQLECVLAELDGNLTGQEGRPVIVTVGARPPHPPRVDPVTRIIPCPRRRDWTVPMDRLRGRHAGIAFGSIRDAGRDQLWQLLGSDAAAVGEYFATDFARALGLTSDTTRPSAPPIALPLFAG